MPTFQSPARQNRNPVPLSLSVLSVVVRFSKSGPSCSARDVTQSAKRAVKGDEGNGVVTFYRYCPSRSPNFDLAAVAPVFARICIRTKLSLTFNIVPDTEFQFPATTAACADAPEFQDTKFCNPSVKLNRNIVVVQGIVLGKRCFKGIRLREFLVGPAL